MPKFYVSKPDDFNDEVKVSTVFIEADGKILFLLRKKCKLSPNTWGVPGGKIEKDETPVEALLRELWEEIKLQSSPKDITFIQSLYVHHPKMNYELYLFRWILSSMPVVTLDHREHTDYIWQPINKVSELPLLEGQLEAFLYVYPSN